MHLRKLRGRITALVVCTAIAVQTVGGDTTFFAAQKQENETPKNAPIVSTEEISGADYQAAPTGYYESGYYNETGNYNTTSYYSETGSYNTTGYYNETTSPSDSQKLTGYYGEYATDYVSQDTMDYKEQDVLVVTEDTFLNENLIVNELRMEGGSLYISNHRLVVKNDVVIDKGEISVYGGRFECNNLEIKEDGYFYSTSFKSDIVVNGDFIFAPNNSYSHFGGGSLYIKGDLIKSKDTPAGLSFGYSLCIFMCGDKKQTISLDSREKYDNYVTNIIFTNTSEEGVVIDGELLISQYVSDLSKNVSGCIVLPYYTKVDKNYFSGDVRINDELQAHRKLGIGGDLYLSGGSNALGDDFNVEGDLYIDDTEIYLMGYTLNVGGNVNIQGGGINVGNGEIHCEGDFTIENSSEKQGFMRMNDNDGYVFVGGDFNTKASVITNTSPYLLSEYYAGTLEIKGDFNQVGDEGNFFAYDQHKVILSGDKKQTVSFDYDGCRFANLFVDNASEEGIYSSKPINADFIDDNGCRIDDAREGILGWKLEEDTVIDGDFLLRPSTLDLNGHKLTVKGDFLQSLGVVKINGGELVVEGDYYLADKKEETDELGKSSGRLFMNNSEDKVLVKGDLLLNPGKSTEGMLTDGTLEVKGNITYQLADMVENENYYWVYPLLLETSDDFKLVLSGEDEQKIVFLGKYETDDYNKYKVNAVIANLEIKNSNVIIEGGNLQVSESLTEHGNKVDGFIYIAENTKFENNICNSNACIVADKIFSEDIVFRGDLNQFANVTYKGNVEVGGKYCLDVVDWDIEVPSKTDLCGNTMTVQGDMILSYGSIELNGGRINAKSDLLLDYWWDEYDQGLVMNNPDDYVCVDGDLTIHSYAKSSFNNGVIEVKGDLIQEDDPDIIEYGNDVDTSAAFDCKVILSGDTKQRIYTDNPNVTFKVIELKNTSDDGIYLSRAELQADEIIDNGVSIHRPIASVEGWKLEEDTVIDTAVYLKGGVLDLNGYTLTVKGNLYFEDGEIALNGGQLIVNGDFDIATPVFEGKDGAVQLRKSTGVLNSNDPAEKIIVGGSFNMIYGTANLAKSVLEVKGDFNLKNADFIVTDNHTILLSGDSSQKMEFSNYENKICNLEITNTSEEGVSLDKSIMLYVDGNLTDEDSKLHDENVTIKVDSIDSLKTTTCRYNLYIQDEGVLSHDLKVEGYIEMHGNVDVNGHKLEAGRISLSSGILDVNEGRIEVANSFYISYYGILKMMTQKDYVLVNGEFGTSAYNSHEGFLTAGVLEVKGDFNVNRYGKSFAATGDHTTILSGMTPKPLSQYYQNIKIRSSYGNRFAHLVLNKDLSLYYFDSLLYTICDDYYNTIDDHEAPAKVTNISATDIDYDHVELTWDEPDDNIGVTGYEIYRNGVYLTSVKDTSFISTGLLPKTTYSYTIIAYDEMKNKSEESDAFEVTTPKENVKPTKPYITSSKIKTGSSITIIWSASTDNFAVEGYNIYRDGVIIAHVTADTTRYRDDTVKLGTKYSYAISAVDTSDNESELSSPTQVQPEAPYISNYYPYSSRKYGEGTMVLRLYYYNLLEPRGYDVVFEYQEQESDNLEWKEIATIHSKKNTSSFEEESYEWDYSKLEGGKYKIRFRVYDADGYFDEEILDCTLDTDVPEAPKKLSVSSDNGVNSLVWSKSESKDCVRYIIYRSLQADSGYSKIAEVGNNTSYEDKTCEKGKTYFYKISGVDDCNKEGECCQPVSIKVEMDEIPPQVTSIFTVGNEKINANATVMVKASDNLKLNTVSLAYEKGEKWVLIGSKNVTEGSEDVTFTFDTTKIADGVYKFRAIATDKEGNNSEPCYKNITVDNTGISKIVISEVETFATYITLKWNDVPDDDIACFIVEQLKGSQYVEIARSYNTLGVHIKNLTTDTEYSFRVVGYDKIGNRGIPSDVINVSTTKDTTAPLVTSFGPSNRYQTNEIKLAIKTKDDVGVKGVKLAYSYDMAEWNEITTIDLTSAIINYTFAYNFDVTQLKEGNVYIKAEVYDEAGNISNYNGDPVYNQFIIDRTAPNPVENVTHLRAVGYNVVSWDNTNLNDTVLYDIYRSNDGEHFNLLVGNCGRCAYNDSNIVAGVKYTYKVLVKDYAGNTSELSDESIEVKSEDEELVVYAMSPENNAVLNKDTKIQLYTSDNIVIKNAVFMYRKYGSNSAWTYMNEVTIDPENSEISANWEVSNLEDDKYEVEAYLVDEIDRQSNVKTAVYRVDTKGPNKPVLTVSAIGYGAILKWTENSEADFSYYKVYRKTAGEEFKLIDSLEETIYTDKNLEAGKEYLYKVSALDVRGNLTDSDVIKVVPTFEDTQAPVAKASDNMAVRVGDELKLDGSQSKDNVGITEYIWNLGNGDEVKGEHVSYVYHEKGIYDASLTVKDKAGNEDTYTFTVEVRGDDSALLSFKFIGNKKSGNGTYKVNLNYTDVIIEGNGYEEQFMTDMYGNLDVALPEGKYVVKAYNPGYLPKSITINLVGGAEIKQEIELEEGEVLVGELTSRRLTLSELQDLGVDLQDPNNWETHVYVFQYYPQEGKPAEKGEVKLEKGSTVEYKLSDSSQLYIRYDEVGKHKVITKYIVESYLKKMYDIHLEVTNQSPEGGGFDVDETIATLNLPNGLSLLDIKTEQSLEKNFGTVHAQETVDTHWYIKADRAGEYKLSASLTGILQPFGRTLNTEIVASNNLVVEPGEDNTFTDPGFATNPVNYQLKVVDKFNNRIKGAKVTLQYGNKKCESITNLSGVAMLKVNHGDTRIFTLTVEHPDYLRYSEKYQIDVNDLYIGKVILYKEGETPIETGDESPYVEKYKIPLKKVWMDQEDILYKVKTISYLDNSAHSFDFIFGEKIDSYTLTVGNAYNSDVIAKGNANSDELHIDIKAGDINREGKFRLSVKTGDNYETYELNVNVIKSVFKSVKLVGYKNETNILYEQIVIDNGDEHEYTLTGELYPNIEKGKYKFELLENFKLVKKSTDGIFVITPKMFKATGEIDIVVTDKDDKVVCIEELNIIVRNTELLPKSLQFEFDSNTLKFTIPEGAPLVGGRPVQIEMDGLFDKAIPIHPSFAVDGGYDLSFTLRKEIDIFYMGAESELNVGAKIHISPDCKLWTGDFVCSFGVECELPNFYIGPVPVRITLSGSVEQSCFGLILDLSEGSKIKLNDSLAFLIELGIEGYVYVGIDDVITGGFYGSATLGIGVGILPKPVWDKVYLEGKLGVRAEFLKGEYSLEVLNGKLKFIDRENPQDVFYRGNNPKSYSEDDINKLLKDMNNYSQIVENNSEVVTEWLGSKIDSSSDEIQTLQKIGRAHV